MNKYQKLAKLAGVNLAAFAALVLSTGAQAAIDVTTATAGIGDASTAVLSILALMVTMAAGIYGVRKVMALFGK